MRSRATPACGCAPVVLNPASYSSVTMRAGTVCAVSGCPVSRFVASVVVVVLLVFVTADRLPC